MKKIIAILITLLMCLNTTYSYAQENTLSLEDALKRVETSSNMKLMDYGINKMYYGYQKFKDMMDAIPMALISSLSDQQRANMGFPHTKKDKLAQDKTVYIQTKTMENTYNDLKDTRSITNESLKLGVEELFNGILLTTKGIELQQEVVNIKNTQFKNSQEKFDKGLLSKNDLEKMRLDYQNNLLKLNSQKRSKQNMVYTLNKMLGVKINTEYSIIGKIEKLEAFNFNTTIEKYIEKALANRLEIKKQKAEIENLEKEFLFTQVYYVPEDTEYKLAELKIKVAEEKLSNLKDDIEFELENAFETLAHNFEAVTQAEVEVENANTKYKDTEEKFKAGLITKDILDSVHLGVSSAELKYMSAVSTYNLSVKKFNLACGIGPQFK